MVDAEEAGRCSVTFMRFISSKTEYYDCHSDFIRRYSHCQPKRNNITTPEDALLLLFCDPGLSQCLIL